MATFDVAYLHERLRYEAATGKLYWRPWPPHVGSWNAKHAGREAFTADTGQGYRCGRLDGTKLRAHHVVWAMHHGAWPDSMLDHRDKDRANNRIGNLRLATRVVNARNQTRYRNNTTGATGVYRHKDSGKWQAKIKVDGRHRHLGIFEDFEDAVRVRSAAEDEHGFYPGHGQPRQGEEH